MGGAKGVRIAGLSVPGELQPGETATAEITATNTSNWIAPWDEDRCNAGNVGLLVEGVLVGPDGEEHVGDTVCAEQHDIVTSYEVTSTVTFDAPERDGTHRYEAFVRTAETGEESATVSESIAVFTDSEDVPDGWDDGDDGGDGGDGGGNQTGAPFGFLFGSQGPLGGGEGSGQVKIVAALVLAAAGAYAAGNLFDIQIGGGSA